jgi:hypothetical protein
MHLCDLKTEEQFEGACQANIIVVEMEQTGQQQNSGYISSVMCQFRRAFANNNRTRVIGENSMSSTKNIEITKSMINTYKWQFATIAIVNNASMTGP